MKNEKIEKKEKEKKRLELFLYHLGETKLNFLFLKKSMECFFNYI